MSARIGVMLLLRSPLRWGFLPITLLTVFLAESLLWQGLSIWANATQAIVQTVIISGPLFAAFAGWHASQASHRTVRERWKLSADGGIRANLAMFAGNTAWSIASYGLLAVIILVQTSFGASWGVPTWPWLISGALSLTLHVAIGHLLGYLVPFFLTPAITAVALFILDGAILVLGGPTRVALLSPGYTQTQQVAFRTNMPLLWEQGLWFLGLVLVLIGVIVALQRARPLQWLPTLSAGVLAASAGALLVVTNPNGFLILDHEDWEYYCEGAPSICLHPAYESARPQIGLALAPILIHLEGTAFDRGRFEWTNRGYLGAPGEGAIAFHLDRLSPGWEARTRVELARDLVTAGSQSGGPCERYPVVDPMVTYSGLNSIVAAWLADSPELIAIADTDTQAAADWFLALPDSERWSWLTRHLEQVCSGTLTLDDFA